MKSTPKILKPGVLVRVYEDPYSRLKYEDTAKLIARLNVQDDGYERWTVRFDDHDKYPRLVHPSDITE